MFRFPFFGYPYNYRYYNYYNNYMNSKLPIEESTGTKKENSITNSKKISNTIDPPIFEILGIKIYQDDLIILALLYFLYQQDIKDEMLYIVLFLLLLS